MSKTETEASSRLSMTKRADNENAQQRLSAYGTASTALTEREGVTLRQEARDWHSLEDAPATWTETTDRWRNYIEEKQDQETVMESESGRTARVSRPHRFHPDYSDRQYAKLKDLERELADEYGKRLHTTMLTFTASSTDDDDRPLPPVDHLDGLLDSWESVRRALDRSLDGRRYERLAILEPHKSGYLHIHMAVFVDGKVARDTFAPVIEAHLRNCDLAGDDAHRLDDDSTISVRHAGSERDLDDDDQLDDLACYLAEYLGAYGGETLEQPDHVQRANALLWVTQRRRWRPSDGAQSYMKHEPDEDDDGEDWHLVGIDQGDGDVIPVDPEDSTSVDTFTTGPPPG